MHVPPRWSRIRLLDADLQTRSRAPTMAEEKKRFGVRPKYDFARGPAIRALEDPSSYIPSWRRYAYIVLKAVDTCIQEPSPCKP